MPKVSVIMPTYNCGRYIGEAIDSVLSQTYKDIEIIVVDDGSDDDTREALRKYEGKIRYIYLDHQGVSSARNSGINMASGRYIAFLDADDMWLPEKLERQTAFLSENNEAGLVVCDLALFDYRGDLEGTYFERTGFKYSSKIPDNAFRALLETSFCNPGAALIRKNILDKAGLFDTNIVCGEDLDLFLRIAAYSKIGVMREALARRRMYADKTKSSSIDMDTRKNNYIYILNKINKSFRDIIWREKIDIIGLKAKAYFGYGYEHFIQNDFLKARSDFRKSLREKISYKGFIFYTLTFLNRRTILWLLKIKGRSIS